jgi:hypothetical protein
MKRARCDALDTIERFRAETASEQAALLTLVRSVVD